MKLNKDQVAKIKQHFKDNKAVYISTAICVAGITVLIMRETRATELQRGTASARVGFSFFSTVNNQNHVVNVLEREGRGHPGYITKCLETLVEYKNQGLAAKHYGVSDAVMSGHLNGKLPDVNGFHFERVGLTD